MLIAAPCCGLTLHVPGDWPTLQQAILASQDGDTILAAPGTHAGPVDFLGRQVRVASLAGPEATVITAGGTGSVVSMVSGEGPWAELEGFTISGGDAPADGGVCGGAIRVENAWPLIRGNIIQDNRAVLGGGICLLQGGARLEGNVFRLNEAEVGGGVYALGGTPVIDDNLFIANQAAGAGFGGGLALEGAVATVCGNIFFGNSARLGGAVSCRTEGEQPAVLFRNSVVANTAPFGGGLYVHQSAPLLESNILAFAGEGAAIWCNQALPRLQCNVVHGNAGGDGLCGEDLGGNLALDPLFCDLDEGDLRLSPGSPCWSTSCGVAGAIDLDCNGTGLGPSMPRPAVIRLDPPHPNPFNPSTTLGFFLPSTSHAVLTLFDLAGRQVAILLNEDLPGGSHERFFHARRLASGIYLLVLKTPDGCASQKLLIVR